MAKDLRSSDVKDLEAPASAVATDLIPVERNGRDVQLTAQMIANLGGGGGAVTSVDGRTGTVTLSDLYDAHGAAATAQANAEAASQPLDADLTDIAMGNRDALPSQWEVVEGTGEVVGTVNDATKVPLTIEAVAGQVAALLKLVDENGGLAALSGGATPWGVTGLIVSDPTSTNPFEKGWITLGINHGAIADPLGEVDFALTYGDASGCVTEFWAGPRNGQSGSSIRAVGDAGVFSEASASARPTGTNADAGYQVVWHSGYGDASASFGIFDRVAALKVRAAPGQTDPVLDVRDAADRSLVRITQSVVAQNAIVNVGTVATGAIDADAGSYTVQVTSQFGDFGDVVVTVGENQATIQAAFDAVAASAFVVTGDWSVFAVEFVGHNANTEEGTPLTITANTLTLLGSPVADPIGYTTQLGIPASITGAMISNTHAAPADAALNNSDHATWLDDTPGATILHIKAKDSGGTVRTASIPLT